MYIFSNALKNIGRNKGRNILVGLVMLAIITTTAVSLVISGTASAVIDDYRTRFDSEVFLVPDFDRVGGGFFEPISSRQHEAFAQSEHLTSYILTARLSAMAFGITAIDEAEGALPTQRMVDGQLVEGEVRVSPNVRIYFTTDIYSLSDFARGQRQIAEGEMFTGVGEAIISFELAEQNNIAVGDTLEFALETGVDTVTRELIITNLELTVAGIFFDGTEERNPAFFFPGPMSNRRNEIITAYETLLNDPQYMEIVGNPQYTPRLHMVEAAYFLASPDYMAAFEADVRRMGLSNNFLVTTDETAFDATIAPVNSLRSISITFMVVVLALGAVIFILLSSIAIRERKYEIGVLRAMGMKKGKVVRGLLYEMVALAAICLVLGLGIGMVSAQPIASILLEQQLEAFENDNRGTSVEIGQGGQVIVTSPDDNILLSEIDVRLGIEVMLQIAAIALLLAVVASIVGIVNITKYEPIKILMERN